MMIFPLFFFDPKIMESSTFLEDNFSTSLKLDLKKSVQKVKSKSNKGRGV